MVGRLVFLLHRLDMIKCFQEQALAKPPEEMQVLLSLQLWLLLQTIGLQRCIETKGVVLTYHVLCHYLVMMIWV
jgi:hypothetical protein